VSTNDRDADYAEPDGTRQVNDRSQHSYNGTIA
jgi:hypothetical protein